MTEESIWGPRVTYSKLPHGYWTLAPVLEAGHRAATLLLQMSDFCDTNRTDGVVRDAQLALFQPARGRANALERLRKVGLVSRVDVPPGWQIDGWLLGHRSRDQLHRISSERSKAGRKGGQSRPRRPAPEAPPTPPADLSLDDLVEQLASGLLDPKQCTPAQNKPATATAVDSNGRGSRGRGGGGVVAEAAALAITRLGMTVEAATDAGVVDAVERALVDGWTAEGIATKATVARSKPYPVPWLLSVLDRGDDPAAHIRM